jgi:hypothetical protein
MVISSNIEEIRGVTERNPFFETDPDEYNEDN